MYKVKLQPKHFGNKEKHEAHSKIKSPLFIPTQIIQYSKYNSNMDRESFPSQNTIYLQATTNCYVLSAAIYKILNAAVVKSTTVTLILCYLIFIAIKFSSYCVVLELLILKIKQTKVSWRFL